MIKRTIAALMCAVLVCTVFASCAKSNKNDDQSNEQMLNYSYDGAYSSYDSSATYAYKGFCEAVYKAETNYRINDGLVDSVLQLFYTSCPLNVLVEKVETDEENGGIAITYKYSADEVREKSKAFEAKVVEILDACESGRAGTRAFILNVYKYVCEKVETSNGGSPTAYDAIMNGKGDSYSVSNMFEFLLRQGGVNSCHILATDASGAGWGLSSAEIDGEFYLFDPMTELIANGGKALCYFGMTTEDAKGEGLKTLVYTNRSEVPVCDNPYFDACRNSVSWKFGENKKALLVTRNDGEIVEIAL